MLKPSVQLVNFNIRVCVVRCMTPEIAQKYRWMYFFLALISSLLNNPNRCSWRAKWAIYEFARYNLLLNLQAAERLKRDGCAPKAGFKDGVYPSGKKILSILYGFHLKILPRRVAWAWKRDARHSPIPRIGRFRSVRSLDEASIDETGKSVVFRIEKSSGQRSWLKLNKEGTKKQESLQ